MKNIPYTLLGLLMVHHYVLGKTDIAIAIEESKVEKVAELCIEIDREKRISSRERAEIYQDLLALAKKISKDRAKISIFHTPDLTTSCAGLIAASFGGYCFKVGKGHAQKLSWALPWGIAGIASQGLAAYLLYSGFTCKNQKALSERAKNVEELVEMRLNRVQ